MAAATSIRQLQIGGRRAEQSALSSGVRTHHDDRFRLDRVCPDGEAMYRLKVDEEEEKVMEREMDEGDGRSVRGSGIKHPTWALGMRRKYRGPITLSFASAPVV